jgi:hypothetical protein
MRRTCVIILLILCRLFCHRERVVPVPVTEPVTEEPVTELEPEQEPVIKYYEL